MTQEERQAAADALNAILISRANKGQKPAASPGEHEVQIDPELDTLDEVDVDSNDIDIEDPDNVLKQQKDRQQAKTGQGNGKSGLGNQEKSDNSNGEPGTDTEDAEDTNEGSSDETEEKPEESGQKDSKEKSGEDKTDSDDDSSEDGEHEGTEIDNESPTPPTGIHDAPSQEYIDAWNEILDRYDRDEVSDDELNELINKINSGEITNL